MNADYTDRGSLQVSVLSEDKASPIFDAMVSITDLVNGSLITELKTNASGQTDTIELPAPPIEYSFSENGVRPYSTYNVTVSANGFETLHIGGVQILSKSMALLNADLKKALPNGFNVRNMLILPNTLWGDFPAKIPEEDIKPLPQSTGFVVLPEPVIPEYMIVHLGLPTNDSAQDVWINFKDYVKNVASSEIYPTWGVETIKANVLAIISFALNRVYTEWYRGKGYHFTITNSTAFDQAFQFGRNIFEEISVVVDDLFTTYITKENIRQPLFTQYCDGRRTRCSGLSQWGSQALGEQGMDAVSILKSYYGSDIYLTSAKKVEGVPSSYGGIVLQMGSTGDDVRTIQTQINKISEHYPAIKKVSVDGNYGEATQGSVKMFQQVFHLPQTGSVDFGTWYEISDIYVGVTKLS